MEAAIFETLLPKKEENLPNPDPGGWVGLNPDWPVFVGSPRLVNYNGLQLEVLCRRVRICHYPLKQRHRNRIFPRQVLNFEFF